MDMGKKTNDAYSTLYEACRMVLSELENARETGVYDLNALKGAIDSFDKESKCVFDACVCASENDSGYHMVDLGLPSGLKWTDRNVGAASPQDYGDYFMCGSTTPDTNNVCDWEHAPFNNGSSSFDEEYFSEHKSEWLTDEGVLNPEYDAAHAIMGGGWRMPTSAEIRELLDGTTRSVEELGGVIGMRFTSKDNGNSIFMPFAGYRCGSDVYYVVNLGYAWSSSLSTCYEDHSNYLIFDDYGRAGVFDGIRCDGFVVRGVHD